MIIHIDLYYFTRFFFLFQGSEVAHETHFAASEESGVIQNLIPGETYVFQIEAMTKIGSGPIRHLEKTMPIGGMIFSLFFILLAVFLCHLNVWKVCFLVGLLMQEDTFYFVQYITDASFLKLHNV